MLGGLLHLLNKCLIVNMKCLHLITVTIVRLTIHADSSRSSNTIAAVAVSMMMIMVILMMGMIDVIIHVFIDGLMMIVIVMKIMSSNSTIPSAIGSNAILGREGDQSVRMMANGSIVMIGCSSSCCCL